MTVAVKSPAPASSAGPPRLAWTRTTPGRMQLARAAIAVSLFLFWIVTTLVLAWNGHAVQTIGKDAVPSIVAAERIRANMADMDANAANAFLGAGSEVEASRKQYEQERKELASDLITAAQNITYGDEERVPIVTMVERLQLYVGGIETARWRGFPVGMRFYRPASRRMHTELLPAAASLDAANFTHLDTVYEAHRARAGTERGLLVLAVLLPVTVLLATQIWLMRRTQRIFNLPLLLATGLHLLFGLWLLSSVNRARADLKVAKEDAFDSLHALWKARAVAYDANGDESLFLLDPENAAAYEHSFHAKSAQLLNLPLSAQRTADSVIANRAGSSGYLIDELNNITFAGEREALEEIIRRYQTYLDIDGKIRALERAGKHRAAVALCIGSREGESNWAFDRFNAALGSAIEINQREFQAAVSHASGGLLRLPYLAPVIAAIAAGLAAYGLHLRLLEYRA